MKTAAEILAYLHAQASPQNVAGMARFGINPDRALGISVNELRTIARDVRREEKDPAARHALAAELWAAGVHEGRILASILAVPALVDEAQMEDWAAAFDSWDLVDQCCMNLFDKTPLGYPKAIEWSSRPEEFVRRAGFSLMASLASHARYLPDEAFEPFFAAILARADDDRNFVKKAVNWALRGIGKRSLALNRRALDVARQMAAMPSRAARWNAKDAIRELQSAAVQARLERKA